MTTSTKSPEHRHYTPTRLAWEVVEGLAASAAEEEAEQRSATSSAETPPDAQLGSGSPRTVGFAGRPSPLWTQLWPRAPQRILQTMQGCAVCRETAVRLAEWCRRMDHPNPLVGCEAEVAPDRLEELLVLPHPHRLTVIRTDVEYWLWGLVVLLLEKGRMRRFAQPELYAELTELARELLPHLDAEFYGVTRMADLEARVLAHLGDSQLRLQRAGLAEEALQKAESAHSRGTRSPRVLGEILHTRAGLERLRLKNAHARCLLTQALGQFRQAGDTGGQLRAQVSLSSVLLDLGQPDAVIELVSSLRDRLEAPEVDPSDRRRAFSNLASAGREVGDVRIMSEVLERLPEDDSLCKPSRRWIEARLAALRGEPEHAVVAYRRARACFLRLGRGWEAALVSLDLIEVLLETGDANAAHAVAADLFEVLEEEGLPRRVAQEVIRFSKLARGRTLSSAVVEEFRAALRKAQMDAQIACSADSLKEASSLP